MKLITLIVLMLHATLTAAKRSAINLHKRRLIRFMPYQRETKTIFVSLIFHNFLGVKFLQVKMIP